jgi:hypothetical protein
MPWLRPLFAALLLAGGAAAAQDRPASEEIGSWVLTCRPDTGSGSCRLRHRTWVVPPGAGMAGAALEVLQRGGRFIPVVALRGLSPQVALGGVLALHASVGLRFDAEPRTELLCGLDGGAVVCAPSAAADADAARELAISHNVLVQARLELPGGETLPQQSRSFALERTTDALVHFRAALPVNESVPVVPGLDWRGLLDRVARDAGWEHGLADLLPVIGGLIGRRTP